jgi:hypothetical protein
MRTTSTLLASVLLLTGTVRAAVTGAENIIKQRAKELVDQNNVRQGVAPPTQQPSPPSGTAAKSTPGASSAALAQFQTSLASIKMAVPVTDPQKQKLTQALIAVAQAVKPTTALATQFIEELTSALVENPLSSSSRSRLVQELDAVLNPGKYPQAKLDGIFADVQAIFQENGLARQKAVVIAEHVKALSADIQKGGAK